VPIRIECLPGGQIEIIRTSMDTGKVRRTSHADPKTALSVLYFLFKREVEREKRARFTPELDLECKKLLKLKLQERENATRNQR
jgi:hypothetical protein